MWISAPLVASTSGSRLNFFESHKLGIKFSLQMIIYHTIVLFIHTYVVCLSSSQALYIYDCNMYTLIFGVWIEKNMLYVHECIQDLADFSPNQNTFLDGLFAGEHGCNPIATFSELAGIPSNQQHHPLRGTQCHFPQS